MMWFKWERTGMRFRKLVFLILVLVNWNSCIYDWELFFVISQRICVLTHGAKARRWSFVIYKAMLGLFYNKVFACCSTCCTVNHQHIVFFFCAPLYRFKMQYAMIDMMNHLMNGSDQCLSKQSEITSVVCSFLIRRLNPRIADACLNCSVTIL